MFNTFDEMKHDLNILYDEHEHELNVKEKRMLKQRF
jgi:hypothetical protein